MTRIVTTAYRYKLVLGLMISISAPAVADTVDLMGAGRSSCGTWTADRASRGVGAMNEESWVVGYLSGAAVYASNLNPLNGVDGNAVWAWMDNYCRAHPLVSINNTVDAFIEEHPR
jgi:hypothetical protein